MDRTELISYFERPMYAVVSSLADDGAPQSAVVGIIGTDRGELVFDTLGTSRKAHNLRRDPRASLVVWEGERTVQLEGIADEPTGLELERLRQVYLAAYPDGLARLAMPHITHFRITPRWARYSDFATDPPKIVELQLT
jgi:hypothetical protein